LDEVLEREFVRREKEPGIKRKLATAMGKGKLLAILANTWQFSDSRREKYRVFQWTRSICARTKVKNI
jgi:hypothetical protein